MSRVGPAFIPSMASMQCPGRNGVFIRGMKPWNSSDAFGGGGGSGLLFLPAGVAGLPGVSRDGPGASEALRPGDAPLGAVLVDAPLGHAPFFRCFPNGEDQSWQIW